MKRNYSRPFKRFIGLILAISWHSIAMGMEANKEPPNPGLPSNFYSWIEKPVNRVQNLFRTEFLPTLWCGIRDVAPDESAVSAIYPHLDSCCRDHDKCPLIIDRGTCFEGLCNPSFIFPILACACEDRFRKCLKALPTAKSLPRFPLTWTERFLSDLLGRGYFKLFPQFFERKCVKRARKVIGCSKWDDEVRRKVCLSPIFDKNSPETWQLFDIEDFNEGWFHFRAYVNDVVGKVSEHSTTESTTKTTTTLTTPPF